jgi:hypothetical protein
MRFNLCIPSLLGFNMRVGAAVLPKRTDIFVPSICGSRKAESCTINQGKISLDQIKEPSENTVRRDSITETNLHLPRTIKDRQEVSAVSVIHLPLSLTTLRDIQTRPQPSPAEIFPLDTRQLFPIFFKKGIPGWIYLVGGFVILCLLAYIGGMIAGVRWKMQLKESNSSEERLAQKKPKRGISRGREGNRGL